MNDSTEKFELKPANENPWYCLATLYGEQPIYEFDGELAKKNLSGWIEWINIKPYDHERFTKIEELFTQRTSLRLPELESNPDFSRTYFDRRVSFDHFHFTRPSDFRWTKFSSDASFTGAQFIDTDFSSANFLGFTNFTTANFNDVDFRSTTFFGILKFTSANLNRSHFQSATFTIADFKSAMFSDFTSFESATFSKVAGFESAKFHSAAYFNKVTFNSANFMSVMFSNRVNFGAATFSSFISFINAEFGGNTVFADTRFESRVPDFRGATMHEATEWHGSVWPKPPSSRPDAQDQVYAYERLKQEMERLKKHEDEQNFFRRELRARRGLVPVSSGKWFLNFAYQAMSGYGDSVSRPLLWLIGVFAVGIAIFARVPLYCGAPMPVMFAARLSFANIFVFLPDKREIMMNAKMVECLSNITQAVSAVQSLLGVVLLFLAGLALRNRFRMK